MCNRVALAATVVLLLWGAGFRAFAADLTQTYRHKDGFALRYPAGWTVQEGEGSVQIAIPGAEQESYFLLSEVVQGVTRPDDDRVIAALEATVKELAPFLNRAGGATPVAFRGGQGATVAWEGRNANGQEMQFRVYLGLLGDRLVQFTAVGAKAALVAREAVIREVFATIGPAEGGAAPPGGGNPLGGNPLGRPAPGADPLAGVYQGDGITLELQRRGEGYTGAITVQGQRYPVTGEFRGETLYGTFQAGGQTYMFAAKLEGGGLKLTSDGNDYRLARQGQAATPAGPANPLGGGAPAAGGPFAGTFALQTPKGTNVLTLQQQGDRVTGTLRTTDGTVFQVEGQVQGNLLAGVISSQEGGMYIEIEPQGNDLKLSYMEVDPNTRQPRRETATAAVFTRQGGGPAGQPAPPVDLGGGVPLAPGRTYEAGQTVTSAECGVALTIPQGYRAQLPEDGGVLVVGNGQGRLALVAAATLAGVQPSPQQLAQDFLVLLTSPAVVGEGAQLQFAGQPQLQGERLVAALQGTGPNGPISGYVIGLVSETGTGNEALVVALGGAGDGEVQRLAEALAGSVRFGRAGVDPSPWHQQLAGHTLINDGGSHSRTRPNTTLSRDNRTTIQLAADGQYAYSYKALGSITTPGGLGGAYETNDSSQGRWLIFTSLTGPTLLLLPQDNKPPTAYALSVDGGQLVMNGAYYSVN